MLDRDTNEMYLSYAGLAVNNGYLYANQYGESNPCT